MENKRQRQKRKVYQIVRTVPWDTMQTRARYGDLPIWMRIMSQLGARVVQLIAKIVRCSAKHTIERKGIGSEYGKSLFAFACKIGIIVS